MSGFANYRPLNRVLRSVHQKDQRDPNDGALWRPTIICQCTNIHICCVLLPTTGTATSTFLANKFLVVFTLTTYWWILGTDSLLLLSPLSKGFMPKWLNVKLCQWTVWSLFDNGVLFSLGLKIKKCLDDGIYCTLASKKQHLEFNLLCIHWSARLAQESRLNTPK